MRETALGAIVFLSGAAVMVIEMVGSRIVAPYLGTSIFVWTSLIGVILAALSLGYWLGGKASDSRPSVSVFSLILAAAAVSVAAVAVAGDAVLLAVQERFGDVRAGAVAAAVLLFAVPGILLGMVSPYAVKLKMTALEKAGATVGALYALSTLGSIFGTFLAGFVLLSHFSNPSILLGVAALLAALSAIAHAGGRAAKAALAVFFAVATPAAEAYGEVLRGPGFVDENTPYSRVWIFDGVHHADRRPVRVMQINDENSSSSYLDSAELVDNYARYYRLAKHFKPDLKRALLIGGAAYSYPKDFLERHPEATLDVVEIDPGVTDLARRYFGLKDDPRLKITHEDARTYLNRGEGGPYDVIYGDAFRSFSIPFQLTTVEAVRRMHAMLSDDGFVLLNLISAVEGPKGRFLRAEVATFREAFALVQLYPVESAEDGQRVQNVMLAAFKSKRPPKPSSQDLELHGYLQHLWLGEIPRDMPVLTDDFAPVDEYMKDILSSTRKSRLNPMRERLKALKNF